MEKLIERKIQKKEIVKRKCISYKGGKNTKKMDVIEIQKVKSRSKNLVKEKTKQKKNTTQKILIFLLFSLMFFLQINSGIKFKFQVIGSMLSSTNSVGQFW